MLFSSYSSFPFLISFYSSILLFLSVLILLILLILLVLFFVFLLFFSYILICLLYYRHTNVPVRPYVLTFVFYTFLLFFELLFLLFSSYSSLYRKPREKSSLGKNPPKFTTAYIVQQSNCRWHCEPTCFSSLA